MKKLLLGLFVLGAMAHGNEAIMKVNANVLETLTIRIDKDVEFGNVAKGSKGSIGIGEFSVKGEQGNSVRVNIEEVDKGVIQMKHSISGAIINASIIEHPTEIQLNTQEFVKANRIAVELDVPSDSITGVYEGDIHLSVWYN